MRKFITLTSIFMVLLITLLPNSSFATKYERIWCSEFVYDIPIGTFTEGTYSYRIEVKWTEPTPGSFVTGWWPEFEISYEAPFYEEFVVFRVADQFYARVRDENGLRCEIIDPIFHPDQPMRPHIGWAIDEEMTYSEAKAHFKSMTEKYVFSDGSSFGLERSSPIWPWSEPESEQLLDVIWEKRKCSWTMRP